MAKNPTKTEILEAAATRAVSRYQKYWGEISPDERALAEKITIAVEYAGGVGEASKLLGISKSALDNYRAGRRQPKSLDFVRIQAIGIELRSAAYDEDLKPIKQQQDFLVEKIVAARESLEELPAGALAGIDENRSSLPVYGTAAASLAGAIAIDDNVIDYIDRPAGLRGAVGAYALYVVGTSMEPRFHAGDLVFVHPGRPLRSGDIVVIQTRNHETAPSTAWLKELVSHKEDRIITRQYNPEAEVKFTGDKVSAIHHVMTVNELFGV